MTNKTTITPRERYVAALTFGTPDRIPFEPGGPRESTLKRWSAEGMPTDRPWRDALAEAVGLPGECWTPACGLDVDFRMRPTFEEKVLEHRDGHYIVQDWMGNITEISDAYDVTYIRRAVDFVTRKWHKFPVENRADFAAMKERYDATDPDRYPEDFDERVVRLRDRKGVATLSFSGPFWQLREWCGFEPLCMLLIEDPEFVREMIAFWIDFVSRTMARALDSGVVDAVRMCEDMAYKEKSMISPAMTREFLAPAWTRWAGEARQAGVPLVDMDSDGKVDELIPIWIESGINVCDPIEVAAGNDLVAYRQTFGERMAWRQGVDKRCMAKGGTTIEAELARLEPVARAGGYIPGCDHGVPPDISWPHFIHYSRRLAEMTGWL